MKNSQQFIIDIYLSDEEDELLMILSRRVSPDNNDWYRQIGSKNLNTFRCLICNEINYGGADMVDHAKNHLKESNLLPFI